MRINFKLGRAKYTAETFRNGDIYLYLAEMISDNELMDTIIHEELHAILFDLAPKLTVEQHHYIIRRMLAPDWY